MSSFPFNRVVAFLGPYIALLSGAIVDGLFVHLHFLANWHTSASAITNWLTQALIFALTSVLVYLGQHKWLDGWQKWESVQKGIAATPVPEPAQIEQAKQQIAGGTK
jgi:hypothetical protein